MSTKVLLIATILLLCCVGASFAEMIPVPVYGWVTQMVQVTVAYDPVTQVGEYQWEPQQVWTQIGVQWVWVPDGRRDR
jgi:hypothetical protein